MNPQKLGFSPAWGANLPLPKLMGSKWAEVGFCSDSSELVSHLFENKIQCGKRRLLVAEDRAIAHFEKIRQDSRDEVKRRIEQRDKYSIQLSLALAAVVAVSFSNPDLRAVLIAAPLVSIYYTVLILYSYRVHHVLAKYLREEIEPALAYLYGTPLDKEWETYYAKQKHVVPGIRRQFFLYALWIVSASSLGYLWLAQCSQLGWPLLLIASVVYVGANAWIAKYFWKE